MMLGKFASNFLFNFDLLAIVEGKRMTIQPRKLNSKSNSKESQIRKTKPKIFQKSLKTK